jgi:hypothetical protein
MHLKNIGLLIVLSLYCFAISLYSGIAVAKHEAFSKPVSAEQPAYQKAIAAGSFLHTNQSEISGVTCNIGQPAPLKNTHNEIITGFKAIEQLFANQFSQYRFYSKNLLVPLHKTALIFPFHYFW